MLQCIIYIYSIKYHITRKHPRPTNTANCMHLSRSGCCISMPCEDSFL